MVNMSTEYAAEILGVDAQTVSREELRDAFRSLLKAHHPDLAGEEERQPREATTRLLNAAFRWMSLAIEARDEAQLPPVDVSDGWSFSVNEPAWYPRESPPKKRRGSQPKTPHSSPSLYPSLGRQRGVLLLIGAIAMLLGAPWYDAVGLMLTALILGSLLVGRPLEVLGDLLSPLDRLLKK